MDLWILLGVVALTAIGLFVQGKRRDSRPPLGTEAIDHAAFKRNMGRQNSLSRHASPYAGPSADMNAAVEQAIARMHRPIKAFHTHRSNAAHASSLVTGIATVHDLVLFADLSNPTAADHYAIVSDTLATLGLTPYQVDTSTDDALRHGLPLPNDHPAPLVLYIRANPIGDFVAITDDLRDGDFEKALTAAGLTFHQAAMDALRTG